MKEQKSKRLEEKYIYMLSTKNCVRHNQIINNDSVKNFTLPLFDFEGNFDCCPTSSEKYAPLPHNYRFTYIWLVTYP